VGEIGGAVGYGMQVFGEAMGALIGLGSIQKRLRGAHVRLSKAALKPEQHLPEELRSDFVELMEKLDRAESLDDDQAYMLALQVRDMAGEVDRAYYAWEYRPR
jgi:hypothetical protein